MQRRKVTCPSVVPATHMALRPAPHGYLGNEQEIDAIRPQPMGAMSPLHPN